MIQPKDIKQHETFVNPTEMKIMQVKTTSVRVWHVNTPPIINEKFVQMKATFSQHLTLQRNQRSKHTHTCTSKQHSLSVNTLNMNKTITVSKKDTEIAHPSVCKS